MVATAWPVIDAPTRKARTLRRLQIIDARACVCQANDPGFWDLLESAVDDYEETRWSTSRSCRMVMVKLDLPAQFSFRDVAEYYWFRTEQDDRQADDESAGL
jgi:hypothetical protein